MKTTSASSATPENPPGGQTYSETAQLWARAALLVSATIAAGTFLVAKGTTYRFSTLELGWFRINLSFLIMLPIFLTRQRGKPLPAARDLGRFALLGLMGVTVNQLFFLYGIHLAPAIDGALFYAFTPALVLVAAKFWLKERLTLAKSSGIGLALVGVILVLRARGLSLAGDYLHGDLMLLVAVAAWSGYTLMGKAVLRKFEPTSAIFWSFGFGALSILPFTPIVLLQMDWSRPGWEGWLGLLYLSGATSVVAFSLWYWALQRLEAGQVAVFTNLQPAMTAVMAWWFLGEAPGWPVVYGGLLILLGVWLAQKKPGRIPRQKVPSGTGTMSLEEAEPT